MQLNDKLLDEPMGWVLWLVAAVSAGTLTLAWTLGLGRHARRAAEFGALAGVLVVALGYLVANMVAVKLGKRTIDDAIALTIGAGLEWGLYGLLAGLALERRRTASPAVVVGLAIGVAGLIIATGLLVAAHGLLNSRGDVWMEALSRVLFIALGWGLGLTLSPKTPDVLPGVQAGNSDLRRQ
jgi:hypothetical protein